MTQSKHCLSVGLPDLEYLSLASMALKPSIQFFREGLWAIAQVDLPGLHAVHCFNCKIISKVWAESLVSKVGLSGLN